MPKRRIEDFSQEQETNSSVSDVSIPETSIPDIISSDIEDLEPSSQSSEESREENIVEPFTAPIKSKAFRANLCDELVEFFNKSEKYVKAIRIMCSSNYESIEVEYSDLARFTEPIEKDPEDFLKVLSDALTKVTCLYFPSYHLIRPIVHGRIVNLPVVENIRDLRNGHLNKLIRVSGVVTRRSGIYSLYSIAKYTCMKCNATFGPFIGKDIKPKTCLMCQKNGPFVINSAETIYKDFQQVTIQEIPGTVPSGALPRTKDVLLYFDLIDSCKPGDEVDIVGVYKNNYSIGLNIKNGFPVFSTQIECSSLRKKVTKMEMTDEDIREIKELSRNPAVLDILIENIAPSIYGHRGIKTAVLLAMVGGQQKEKNGMRIRGDINVLIMGDPGTAKSQFLRYVQNTSHRAVLSTGQGSSGVGLTASVRMDPAVNEWVLEGGALVLADRGVCLIDEFDKMNENDRTSIHEAMEQQSISISKAGIIASLHARCSVIAAANPVKGRYNPSLSFAQNVNLSDPIISRFDLLCVVKDEIDTAEDTRMANFILNSHAGVSNTFENSSNLKENKENTLGFNKTNKPKKTISQELLRKYILYARNNIEPTIGHLDIQKISQLYSDLRKESLNSGIPITVRHIESIIRISEAFAKLRLSNHVSKADIDTAISITLDSFLSAQKYAVTKQLKTKFSKYFEENTEDLLAFILRAMIQEKTEAVGSSYVTREEFYSRCKHNNVVPSTKFFESAKFASEGFVIHGEKISRSD